MSYLVDGNNVMAQRVGWHRDKSGARRLLLEDLAKYVKAKGVTVRVVFDGAPDRKFGEGSRFKGVDVSYAVRGSDADERIKQLVEADRERRTLIVVTSDRELASYVRRCGAQVIRSGEFRRKLESTIATLRTDIQSEANMIDEPEAGWMRFFGVSSEDDDEVR
jgi:predicted RNA-binding protein with PIN domain